jgi:hypothetical protein
MSSVPEPESKRFSVYRTGFSGLRLSVSPADWSVIPLALPWASKE